jgi:hypothetical protein
MGKVKENQVGDELSRTRQLLVYADDVNLLGDNIITSFEKFLELVYYTEMSNFTSVTQNFL